MGIDQTIGAPSATVVLAKFEKQGWATKFGDDTKLDGKTFQIIKTLVAKRIICMKWRNVSIPPAVGKIWRGNK